MLTSMIGRAHNSVFYDPADTPVLAELTAINIQGVEAKRCVVILRTRGCSYARGPSGGCKHCALLQNSHPGVSHENLERQLEHVLTTYHNETFQQLDILTLGSFFDDNEIPEEFRKYALGSAVKIKSLRKVFVESRPEFLTVTSLQSALNLLNGAELEVGIGIESSNEFVRRRLLNKGFSLAEVERSVELLSELGASFLGYVLVKPLGMTEKDAIEDAVKSVQYVFQLGEKHKIPARVAIEPFYIPRKSVAENEYRRGNYEPLRLWSLIEILERVNQLGVIFVGLNDEGLSDGLVPSNCDSCNPTLLNCLQQYNSDQKIDRLLDQQCSCKEEWKASLGLPV
jgi:archaeosine synthase beta-subunit